MALTATDAGVAVRYGSDGIEDELIFDPASATMREERSVAVASGAAVSRTTYLARAVTDTPR
jgi:hypothetical protein